MHIPLHCQLPQTKCVNILLVLILSSLEEIDKNSPENVMLLNSQSISVLGLIFHIYRCCTIITIKPLLLGYQVRFYVQGGSISTNSPGYKRGLDEYSINVCCHLFLHIIARFSNDQHMRLE